MNEQLMSAVYAGEGDTRFHWSPESQTYAAAATLLEYLRQEWQLEPLTAVESFFHHGGRHVDVYYFTLSRRGQQLEMPVLANPAVFKLVNQRKQQVVRVNGKPDKLV